jgi:hypothetical protein
VKDNIKESIVSQGDEMYDLELIPIMEEMEFDRGSALPYGVKVKQAKI